MLRGMGWKASEGIGLSRKGYATLSCSHGLYNDYSLLNLQSGCSYGGKTETERPGTWS